MSQQKLYKCSSSLRSFSPTIVGPALNVNITKTYTPTADKSAEELNEWFTVIEIVIKLTKAEHITIISEDFKAKVGKVKVSKAFGDFGLGARYEWSERLI